jgi:hypothetical protein
MGKTLDQMTPAERCAAIKRAAARLQDELQANSQVISEVLASNSDEEA